MLSTWGTSVAGEIRGGCRGDEPIGGRTLMGTCFPTFGRYRNLGARLNNEQAYTIAGPPGGPDRNRVAVWGIVLVRCRTAFVALQWQHGLFDNW